MCIVMTETIPTLKLDAEPLIMGKVEFDGENSTGLVSARKYNVVVPSIRYRRRHS